MNIKWSADMTTQIVNGAGDSNATIDDWQQGRILTAEDTRTNNGTKGNPSLVADVFGDWREELLVRTSDSSNVRIYTNTEITNHKLYTLMHDPQYRAEVARQNTTYNQPSYTSFYFASDTDWANVPVPNLNITGMLSVLEKSLVTYKANGEVSWPLSLKLESSLKLAKLHLKVDSEKRALAYVENFITEANKKHNKKYISTTAKLNLTHHAQLVMDSIKKQ